MSGEFCELCLLPRSMCAHRTQIRLSSLRYDWAQLWKTAHPDDGLRNWIISEYGGRCRGCGALFEVGDLIRYYEDEDGYLAECCGDSPA